MLVFHFEIIFVITNCNYEMFSLNCNAAIGYLINLNFTVKAF